MTRALWWMVGLGTAVRLVLAFTTFGEPFDIGASAAVANGLVDGTPFDVYGDVGTEPVPQWPYPPGFFPFVLLSGGLARLLPGHFDDWIQLGPILADAALALVVQRLLARGGHTERVQLAAVALVAFGPIFLIVSGHRHQIDAVAALPALLGAAAWDARRGPERARVAGLLIGLAAVVKSPLALLVFALLPTARGGREGAAVAGWAAAVPLLALAPFVIAEPSATLESLLSYSGVAGHGMLSALVEPHNTEIWVTSRDWAIYRSRLAPFAPFLLAAVVAGVVAAGLRRRPPALPLAVVLWLAIWAFGPGFFFHYLIWGLPFLLVLGRLWEAAVLQVTGVAALLLMETGPHGDAVLVGYRVLVYGLFALTVLLLVRSVRALRPA